jgi:hypothetical protein
MYFLISSLASSVVYMYFLISSLASSVVYMYFLISSLASSVVYMYFLISSLASSVISPTGTEVTEVSRSARGLSEEFSTITAEGLKQHSFRA